MTLDLLKVLFGGRGELNEWSKKTDTELATRVPFIIRVPWASASIGKSTPVKAELIDMYHIYSFNNTHRTY